MIGNELRLFKRPKRIISLVPSQTELLYDLGLKEEVIAQTLFCIFPEEMHKTKPRIGGTKNLKIDKIISLQPDLIIANKEENDREQVLQLQSRFPVWVSDIKNLEDALFMIQSIGEICDKEETARVLLNNIIEGFGTLKRALGKQESSLYFIWREPWMVAGTDTFIHHMMEMAGFKNALPFGSTRYPTLTEKEIIELNPERILLSSEPYPFKGKHMDELKAMLPNASISLVDGTYFSWYGSRLKDAVKYFNQI